ncbi:MAG: hypothetical protein EHM43_03335, partial [Ignavibacteriae bacterium]
MRFSACLAVVFAATTSLFSQQLVTVVPTAPRPVCILPDGDRMHVLTDRVDVNYNNVKDDGDQEATWQIVNAESYETIRTLTFPWAFVTANRPAIDRETGLLYIGVGDTVWAYTTLTQQRSSEPVFVGSSVAVGLDEYNSHLFITQRTGFTDPGTLVDVNLLDRSTTSTTLEINPQMTIGRRGVFNNNMAITVNEGNYGANDGLLTFWDGTNVMTLGVGDTPNHIYVNPDAPSIGYVTCNGSHSVVVVELDGRYAIDTFAIPTSGYNGPRECTSFDGLLYVTSYSADVFALDAQTGALIYTLSIDAKVDAAGFYQNKLWVGRSYEKGEYAAVPNVNVYDILLTDVQEVAPTTTTRRAYVVTGPTISIPALNPDRPLTLINMQGASSAVTVIDPATMTLNVDGVPAGVYVLTDGSTSVA